MIREHINLKEILILLAVIVLLSACAGSIQNQNSGSQYNLINDLKKGMSDPSAAKYLGDGINLLGTDSSHALKKSAVTITDAWRNVGYQSFMSSCQTVINSSDIMVGLDYKTNSSAVVNIIDQISFKPSFSMNLSAKYHLKKNTVSMLAIVEYEYATVIANKVQIKPEVFTDPLCQTTINGVKVFSPLLFKEYYGDGFISKARLGERLYIVYEAQITDTSLNTKAEVKDAMEAKFLEIVGGNYDSSTLATADTVLNNTTRNGYIFATGGIINTEFSNSEDAIKKSYMDFGTYLSAKVANPSTSEFSIIESNISSYQPYLDAYTSVDEPLKKLIAWQKLFGKIQTVEMNRFDSAILYSCAIARENIALEIEKCRENSPSARYPLSNEYSELIKEWDSIIVEPEYRVHVEKDGWIQGWVTNGSTAGTTNQSKRAEAVQIRLPLEADPAWNISYRVHEAGIGWSNFVDSGKIAGTTGQSRQIEAIEILLKGMPSKYHVKYRAHIEKNGWNQGWVYDGVTAGTTGNSQRLEAIEVVITTDLPGTDKKTPDSISPSIPTGLTVTAVSANKISLNWNPSTDDKGVAGYSLYVNNQKYCDYATNSGSIIGQIYGPTYSIQIDAFDSSGNRSGKSDILTFQKNKTLATIETYNITQVSSTSAIIGGLITNDGGGDISARGICWSTSTNPTISDYKAVSYDLSPVLFNQITGLTQGTIYHARAYVTNSEGTSYGADIAFGTHGIDNDGNIFKTTLINNQLWMAENLKSTRYRDGTYISNVVDDGTWGNTTTEAYCWFQNNPANKDVYGALYNWYAFNNPRNIAPPGWHVPSEAEVSTLIANLGANPGGQLKETSLEHWASPNTGATNAIGFNAIPSSYRNVYGTFSMGAWQKAVYWWTTDERDADNAKYFAVNNTSGDVIRNYFGKRDGFSVRLIRDY